MTFTIGPLIPFPPASWWAVMLRGDCLVPDTAAVYRKMSMANRYRIATANGPQLLTVPLAGGRDQRASLSALRIHNNTQWQQQHWRTIYSAYGRAPYFEHYSMSLEPLFKQQFDHLYEFSIAAIKWVMRELRLKQTIAATAPPEHVVADVSMHAFRQPPERFPHYMQLFEDRNGFFPDLSILDLLFNEGPETTGVIKSIQTNV